LFTVTLIANLRLDNLQLQRSYAYARIVPTTSVPTFTQPSLDVPRAKEKIRLGHLPAHLVVPFDIVFAPRLRTLFGMTLPWEMPSNEDVERVWAAAFPNEDALEIYSPIGTIVQKLVSHTPSK
jgi:hypothetical protein